MTFNVNVEMAAAISPTGVRLRIDVPYGQDVTHANVPDDRLVGVITLNKVPAFDEDERIGYGLEHPVSKVDWREFIGRGEPLVVVNDQTRPTPTRRILDHIGDELAGSDAKFIVATGSHRGPNEQELKEIFGKWLDAFRDRILVHDAKKKDDLVELGATRLGTPVWFNRRVAEARMLVLINSVEPHYFAGYTGGRKSLVPGVAGYQTIEANHKHALEPAAKGLALKGNPVHEDMMECVQFLKDKQMLSIQLVLDEHQKVFSCIVGDLDGSFMGAVGRANELFVVKVPCKAEVVVTVARHPMDIDLYQSQKALDNGKLALAPGGTIILVSKCRQGVGPRDFFELLASSPTPDGVLERIGTGYKLGYHKAAKIAEIAQWAQMSIVSDLPDEDCRKVFMKPFSSLQQALNDALQTKGDAAKVLFLLDGTMSVPMV